MSLHTHDENGLDDQRTVPGSTREGRSTLWAIRDGIGAVVGVVLGVAPHVLHHIGLLAGAALITGALGNALFYLIGLLLSRGGEADPLRLFFGVGLLGGFTTFSAFSAETFYMIQQGQFGLAAIYVSASVLGALCLLLAGLWLARAAI